MERKEFYDAVKQAVKEKYAEMGKENISIDTKEILKNNGILLTGLTIMEDGKNISPTIYLDNFYSDYEEGKSINEIAEKVIEINQMNQSPEVDIKGIMSKEYAKDMIYPVVIGIEQNEKLLADCPHKEVEDLAIMYRLRVNMPLGDEGVASILLRKDHLQMLGMTEQEVHEAAVKNVKEMCKPSLMSMRDVFVEMYADKIIDAPGMDAETAKGMAEGFVDSMMSESDVMMYVLTNQSKQNGAYYMLDKEVMGDAASKLGGNLYVIPSSIHECILLKEGDVQDELQLKDMVESVNATEVSPEEVLSNNVYFYNQQTEELSIVGTGISQGMNM